MLRGIIAALTDCEELEKRLRREGLQWAAVQEQTEEGFMRALLSLGNQIRPQDVLCLVETDRAEQLAGALKLSCAGCLKPSFEGEPEQSLWNCLVLFQGLEGIDRAFLERIHTRALGLPVRIAETKRLILRELALSDLDAAEALFAEAPECRTGEPADESRKEREIKLKAYIQSMYGLHQFGMWAVIEKESGCLIGRAGFGIADYLGEPEVDFGYVIQKSRRGRGYGEEACRAALSYGKEELEFPGVSAYIAQTNEKSQRLAEKLGFVRTDEFFYEGSRMYRYYRELHRKDEGKPPV